MSNNVVSPFATGYKTLLPLKTIPLIFITCFLASNVIAQHTSQLKEKLDSIYRQDQKARLEIQHFLADETYQKHVLDSANMMPDEYLQQILVTQEQTDQSNLHFIDSVIRIHGYPGKSLVGSPTNEVAWYIIQHSSDIGAYFHLVKSAGKKHELPYPLVCRMQDRLLLQKNRKQRYGTQSVCMSNGNGTLTCFISPLRNPEKVNTRRKKAGFDQTIEQYADEIGAIYPIQYNKRDQPKPVSQNSRRPEPKNQIITDDLSSPYEIYAAGTDWSIGIQNITAMSGRIASVLLPYESTPDFYNVSIQTDNEKTVYLLTNNTVKKLTLTLAEGPCEFNISDNKFAYEYQATLLIENGETRITLNGCASVNNSLE